MTPTVSARGTKLVANFEGFRSHPYLDAVGVPTIGFGHTHGVTMHSAPITRARALALLRHDLNGEYGSAVARLVKVSLSQNEFDALTSFVYNLGPGALEQSTLLKLLNRGKRRAAADEFLKWDKAGGQVLLGLLRRRKAERALFLHRPFRSKYHQIVHKLTGGKA